MKTYALYGMIYGIVTTVVTLLCYFTGLQTEHIGIGLHAGWFTLSAFFVILYLGVKENRETKPEQRMRFGAAFSGALIISLVAGTLNGSYAYFHFSKINPEFGEFMAQYQQAKLTSAGLPDEMVEKIVQNMSKGFTPLRQSINALVGTIIVGLIFGLLLAPANTQRGSLIRITLVNGIVGGMIGLLAGTANGFLYRAIGSYALIGLLAGGLGTAIATFLTLKLSHYTVRFAGEEFD